MITGRFIRKGGKICAFQLDGHALTAPKGEDIVCAGVSASCELVVNGITEILGIDAQVSVDEKNGSLYCALPDDCKDGAAYVLMASLKLELELIGGEYPAAIKIIEDGD